MPQDKKKTLRCLLYRSKQYTMKRLSNKQLQNPYLVRSNIPRHFKTLLEHKIHAVKSTAHGNIDPVILLNLFETKGVTASHMNRLLKQLISADICQICEAHLQQSSIHPESTSSFALSPVYPLVMLFTEMLQSIPVVQCQPWKQTPLTPNPRSVESVFSAHAQSVTVELCLPLCPSPG